MRGCIVGSHVIDSIARLFIIEAMFRVLPLTTCTVHHLHVVDRSAPDSIGNVYMVINF